MKKVFLFILLNVITFQIMFGQFEGSKQVFEIDSLKTKISTHKKVAIIPFKGQISYKRMPKGFDPEANKQEEKKLGVNLQEGLYTYLLRKQDDYFVNFQEPERTDLLLRKANIYDKIEECTYDTIAKILGVDAVISGSYVYEKTGSEAGAIA